jgi:hypothetical protein
MFVANPWSCCSALTVHGGSGDSVATRDEFGRISFGHEDGEQGNHRDSRIAVETIAYIVMALNNVLTLRMVDRVVGAVSLVWTVRIVYVKL